MTTQVCSLNSSYQDYWNDDAHQERWSFFHQPSERLTANKNPSHPELISSPQCSSIHLSLLILE